MNFDCTLIMKNGTKIPVTIDYIEMTADTFPKFEGHVTGTAYDIRNDAEVQRNIYRNILNSTYGIGSLCIPEIKNVIFNDPATIVFWDDGTKTVVKCQDGDEFDPEKGLAMAIVKKAYGNKGSYCNKMKKWLPKEEPVTIDSDKFQKSFKRNLSDAFDILLEAMASDATKENEELKRDLVSLKKRYHKDTEHLRN